MIISKTALAALITFLNLTTLFSQQNDSTFKATLKIKDENIRTDSLLQIAERYRKNGIPEKTVLYLQEALKICTKNKQAPTQARTLVNLGNAYYALGNYKEAIDLGSKALAIPAIHKNPKTLLDAYNLLGSLSLALNKQDEAVEYFNLGISKAKEAMAADTSLKFNARLARFNSNIGVVYASRGDFAKAVGYFEKTAQFFLLAGDSAVYATSLSNVGAAYFYLNEFDKALKNYEIAKQIVVRNNDLETLTRLCDNIASVYIKQNKFSQAKEYLDLGLEKAKEIKNKELEKMMYKSFYDMYSAQKDPASALLYYIKYSDTKDSLLNESSIKQVNELNKKFETEKKEKEIELLNKEKQVSQLELDHQKSQRNILIVVVTLILLSLGFLVYFFLQKSKNNKILEEKNKLITLKNHTIEEKSKEIIDSITYAKRIQSTLLASNQLLNKHLKEHFILFMPKDIVSGDFYWASELKNGGFALVIADSTGHGVPGAFMSLLNITFLNQAITERGLIQPGEILNHTRSKIIESLSNDGSTEGGKDGMDCTFVNYDFSNNQLHYSCAYNPVWVVRAAGTHEAQLIELELDKMPVGKHDKDNVSFSSFTFDLKKGDVVYSLTDGYADQFGGEKGKKFKYKPLQELIKSIASLPMQTQHQILQENFNKWRGELEQVDDVCISGVRIV